jgi:hypothetical protein
MHGNHGVKPEEGGLPRTLRPEVRGSEHAELCGRHSGTLTPLSNNTPPPSRRHLPAGGWAAPSHVYMSDNPPKIFL